ncbi:MAG: bifunctional hydroxymethylpyrimidine kinase/phosphomethylpyrimidine kinase [Armatimonadetes bacterium]|nr:bifunctional hydroxymethylpyrimidine kinase/phosphomethylpyrimidine kinase [Akkermansiaceae bacterium]
MKKTPEAELPVRVVMTVAGSDCSGGAGIQADLKTFQHFGLHGLSALTCIVSETANIVRRIDTVDVDMLEDQIVLMLESFPIKIVKTGMLGSAKHVARVSSIFANHADLQLIVDPVMISSTGASLLEPDAVAVYQKSLLPLARVITPNIPEAEVLLGDRIKSSADMESAAKILSEKYQCAVLLKGGHLDTDNCIDILMEKDQLHRFSSPRLNVSASHGTGCTLAAAVASGLALGKNLVESVAMAKEYLNVTLATSYSFVGPNGEIIHALNQGTRR